MSINKFSIHVPELVINDLKSRISNTRWPEPIFGSEWEYGANINYIHELCEYWGKEYNWRKQESLLNSFPQFMCNIDGVDIRFWHIKGRGKNPFPLLLIQVGLVQALNFLILSNR